MAGWIPKKSEKKAIRSNDFVTGLFATAKIRVVDIKLEFGRVFNGEEFMTMLVDEVSPDTCKLWDMNSNEKLCYELAKEQPDKLLPAYQEVMKRLGIKGGAK